jgi:hypothetical protein
VTGIPERRGPGNPTIAVGEGGVWVYSGPTDLFHIDPATHAIEADVKSVGPGHGTLAPSLDVAVGFRTV